MMSTVRKILTRSPDVWSIMGLAGLLVLVDQPAPRAADCKAGTLTVAVDAGHSPKRYGATSATGGREFDFNRRFATEFVTLTDHHAGIDAYFISPEEFELSLRQRVDLANASQADVFVSFHHDSAQPALLQPWLVDGKQYLKSNTIGGFSFFVSRDHPEFKRSLEIARALAAKWRGLGHRPTLHHAAKIKGENRELLDPVLGVYEAPFAVIKKTLLPAVLVEVGVLINPAEEQRLNSEAFRARLQDGLIAALLQSRCSRPAR